MRQNCSSIVEQEPNIFAVLHSLLSMHSVFCLYTLSDPFGLLQTILVNKPWIRDTGGTQRGQLSRRGCLKRLPSRWPSKRPVRQPSRRPSRHVWGALPPPEHVPYTEGHLVDGNLGGLWARAQKVFDLFRGHGVQVQGCVEGWVCGLGTRAPMPGQAAAAQGGGLSRNSVHTHAVTGAC